MIRRHLIGAGVVAAAVSLLAAPVAHPVGPTDVRAAQVASGQPNVVLILVDDARMDDLTTLPRVRQLVGDAGATFSDSVSPFPLCCPARATLLTGQYAHNHQVLSNKAPLGGFTKFKDANTLATWLSPDYTTGLIGKYLNQYRPPYIPPGWDSWMVPYSVLNYRSSRWSVDGVERTYPGYQTNTIATLATDFINTHASDAKPFFLYTSIVAPHTGHPIESDDPNAVYNTTGFATPNVAVRYRDRFAGLANTNPAFNEADVRDKPQRPPRLAPWEIDALTEVNAQRRESLLSAQGVTRDIITTLRSTGELDNTYVFFISDNGFLLGEHRIRRGKVFPYEVAVKVPMLLRGPGITPGTVVRQPAGLQDFAPTVLAMTGHRSASGPFPIDGVNLLPMIGNPSLRSGRPIVIEAGPSRVHAPAYRFHGILAPVGGEHWKYVERGTGEKELYDLTRDPAELVNLAGRPTTAATQAELTALLKRYEWCAGTRCR